MAADIQRYLDGIESQHQSKPKFMAMLKAILEKIDDARQLLLDVYAAFDIDSAIGKQQDILGELIGADRRYVQTEDAMSSEVLEDESFRHVMQMQVVANQWDGTYESFVEIWNRTVGDDVYSVCIDNQDMSMDMHINGDLPLDLIRLIFRGYFIPKPGGVRLTIQYHERDTGVAQTYALTSVTGIIQTGLQATAYGGYVDEVEVVEEVVEGGEVVVVPVTTRPIYMGGGGH